MTQLYEIKVKLSNNQKKNLGKAYRDRETIVLRLSKDALSGSDVLYVPGNIVKRLEKNKRLRKGMDIKLAKTNIRNQIGGSLLTTALSLGRVLAPTIGKTLGLSALAGLASEGASQLVKKISGKGQQTGGFIVPQNKIDQLIKYKGLLTKKQKEDIVAALQTGGQLVITPSKTQSGGFLGTLLASIGIPLVLKALTGGAAPRFGRTRRSPPDPNQDGGAHMAMPWLPPPFIGSWDKNTIGYGRKSKNSKGGRGLLLGENSPFNNIPLLGALL